MDGEVTKRFEHICVEAACAGTSPAIVHRLVGMTCRVAHIICSGLVLAGQLCPAGCGKLVVWHLAEWEFDARFCTHGWAQLPTVSCGWIVVGWGWLRLAGACSGR